jgi:hypothetical protein
LFLVFATDQTFEFFAADEWNKVGDKYLLLVLVSTNEGDVLPHRRVSRQVSVDFAEFDSESTNLDLVVRATGTFDGSIWVVATEIPSPVHPVANSVPPLLPRFVGSGDTVLTLDSDSEPVLDEFLRSRFRKLKVTFCESSRSYVDFSDLTDSAKLVLVVAVDDEELNVDHAFSGRHDVFPRLEEGRVFRKRRDREVRDGSLSFSRSKHVDDAAVSGELL